MSPVRSPVNGALNVSEVKDLDPETQYCFQLAGVRGDQRSPTIG